MDHETGHGLIPARRERAPPDHGRGFATEGAVRAQPVPCPAPNTNPQGARIGDSGAKARLARRLLLHRAPHPRLTGIRRDAPQTRDRAR